MKSFFWSWLKARRGALLFWLLFVAVFILIFSLYSLPLEAVLYPAAVSAVLGLFFLALSLRRAWMKHRELEALARTLPDTLTELLPPPETTEDEDYGRLLRLLRLLVLAFSRFFFRFSVRFFGNRGRFGHAP